MEQIQYLEINSSRRNRNLNPLPGHFEVPLSQSGQKQAIEALDPVTLAAPQLQWIGQNFNTIQGTSNPSQLIVMVDYVTTTTTNPISLGNSSATTTLIVNTTGTGASGRGALQIIENYYVFFIFSNFRVD